jgi:hypothetical protein
LVFLGACNSSCVSNGAITSTSASASASAGNGSSKHQLPKLILYNNWAFTSIDYFLGLAIALAMAIVLALAIAPLRYWR